VFYDGVSIKRAGIALLELQPKESRQLGMFEEEGDCAKDNMAMKAIDEIERRRGSFLRVRI